MLSETQNQALNPFFTQCDQLSQAISAQRDSLIELLTNYETHQTAEDEIMRSLEALEGVREEFSQLSDPLHGLNIATFFPLNLPLYSIVLFGVIPSAFAANVFIRPPEVMNEVLGALWDILDLNNLFPAISSKPTPRHIFIDLYAKESDAIIFTGKYENALAIHKACPDALLVYNGSGVNPFMLFEDADVDLAVEKAVEMRCFNSGQDCAGPDAFFVPSSLAEEFTTKLKARLDQVKIGDTKDPAVIVGPTKKQTYIDELGEWLQDKRRYIVYGGEIDPEQHLVHPTVVRKNIRDFDESDFAFHEFFAPYFYVVEYSKAEDLDAAINAPAFRDRGMYVSVFGNNPSVEAKLTFVQVLKNVIVNDVERGNTQYGGFGAHANFLLYGENKIVKPVLISRDVHEVLTPQAR